MKTTVVSVIRDYLLATKRFDEGRKIYDESGGRAFKKWVLALRGEEVPEENVHMLDTLVEFKVREFGGWECLCAKLFYPEGDRDGEVDSGASA